MEGEGECHQAEWWRQCPDRLMCLSWHLMTWLLTEAAGHVKLRYPVLFRQCCLSSAHVQPICVAPSRMSTLSFCDLQFLTHFLSFFRIFSSHMTLFLSAPCRVHGFCVAFFLSYPGQVLCSYLVQAPLLLCTVHFSTKLSAIQIININPMGNQIFCRLRLIYINKTEKC